MTADRGACGICGKDPRRLGPHPVTGSPRICEGCYNELTCPRAECPACGVVKLLTVPHPDQRGVRICRLCYDKHSADIGTCPICDGEDRWLQVHIPFAEDLGKVCYACYDRVWRGPLRTQERRRARGIAALRTTTIPPKEEEVASPVVCDDEAEDIDTVLRELRVQRELEQLRRRAAAQAENKKRRRKR